MQADYGNDASIAELTDFGIRISEVRSLPGLDVTGLAASPLTFPGGLACHERSNQLLGGNLMSLLTGCEQAKCCSWEHLRVEVGRGPTKYIRHRDL